MDKFAVDLDKVLDEFEFLEDRAEQFATILTKRNSSIPSVVGGRVLHPSTATYRRPAFEPINLADADFAADLQISAPYYNNAFSSATSLSPRPHTSETNIYVSHPENTNRNNENRLNSDTSVDCHNSEIEQRNNVTSMFSNTGRIDITALDPNSGVVNDRLESSNKINVSGVFSTLNEYINTGNIEAKLVDADPSYHRAESEDDKFSKRFVGNEVTNHQSSSYPKITSDQSVDIEKLGNSVDVDIWDNNNEVVRLTGDKWTNTIDVCKVSEKNSKSLFADLIPAVYSKSLQEDNRDVGNTSSDETPDLLDTTVITGKSSSFATSEIDGIKSHKSENYSNIVNSEKFSSKDASQPNLSLLPDVASSGRTAYKANMRSDLIVSHGAVESSDDENVEQYSGSQKPLDSVAAVTETVGLNMTETLVDDNNATQCKDISSAPTKVVPVGFNALEELSDAELHQYLEELEGDDSNFENGQDNLEENEMNSVLESQKYSSDLKVSGAEERVSVTNCIDNEKSDIHTKAMGKERDDDSHVHNSNTSSVDISNHQGTNTINSQVCNSVNLDKETLPVTENNSDLVSPLAPDIDDAQSDTDSSACTKMSENVCGAETSDTSNPQAVSKSTSAINNLVTIDCQQINRTIKECNDNSGNESGDINSPEYLEKNGPSEDLQNSSLVQDTIENEKNTPEVKLSLTETNTNERILPDCENHSEETVTEKRNIEDSENADSQIVPKCVTEIEYSEVQSCLVRMPKDGSTINVLGEEERPSRPKYLFLPSKITVENEQDEFENSGVSPPLSSVVAPPGQTPTAEASVSCPESEESTALSSPDLSESSSVEQALSLESPAQLDTSLSDTDDLTEMISPEERGLGKLPPFWVPDAEAPYCMLCSFKFTVIKRRHHCRACGKVLCSKCCSQKFRLEYMDNAEARVCQPCYHILAKMLLVEQGESASGSPSSVTEDITSGRSLPLGRQPNPNNPMEYCSTIPPLEQAAGVLKQPPPSVLVPVGVLKREGGARPRSDVAKQVIFSDGIRPGGDLTELDGSTEFRLPYRKPGRGPRRSQRRVGTPPGPPASSQALVASSLPPLDPKTLSYIPADKGLPPLATIIKGVIKLEEVVDYDKLLTSLRSEAEPPAFFAITKNLFVSVKIVNLDCCINRTSWCFTTSGMSCVGQDEIVIILECLPDESTVPRDLFQILNIVYHNASIGRTVTELGHTLLQSGQQFLESNDYGGFIYVRPSFQCLQKLILPSPPYLVGILFHRWELPWATLFPIRLMLRLGAEYRYYPCMLVSVRNRRPVFWEIGHTIINLLADFRNRSYTLPSVRGMVIHMEDRQTSVLLPRNRYDQVTRAINNSNDHVLAFGSNFSHAADSHLVCVQSTRDDNYQTQAINIHNKPRKVTGASFVVFNGALKASSNLSAKSSIVEDGLMVQITADTMQALRAALRNMQDFSVGCGPSGASVPDEIINLKWVEYDRNFNVGVKSFIDSRPLDGIPSIRVHNGTDYMSNSRLIRWTEVFIIESDESSAKRGDPLDISRLSEAIAKGTCLALLKYLDLLAQAGLTQIAVRAKIHQENVGYEAGSKGEKLPPIYMDFMDDELVPVLHKAASKCPENVTAILELVFHVMLQ